MNAEHLKKALADPEIGRILFWCGNPTIVHYELSQLVNQNYRHGRPIPEHIRAGLNTTHMADIVPNVVAAFITNLEVQDAAKQDPDWLQKLDRLAYLVRCWRGAHFVRGIWQWIAKNRRGE